MLIGAGCDPNAADEKGRTALHCAAAYPFTSCLELVLTGGANPNAVDINRETPLHYIASLLDDVASAQLLLARGADPAARDLHERTPLHLAAAEGNLLILQALLEAGAPINHRDAAGRTALHWAARVNDYDMTAALLIAGADARAKDYAGIEPLELCVGPRHGWGVRAALALLQTQIWFPAPALIALFRNVVRRASDVDSSETLIAKLLQREVLSRNLCAIDFKWLIVWNKRWNEMEGTTGFRPQTRAVLRLLENHGCPIPAELTAELL
jgi:hypothetical protein